MKYHWLRGLAAIVIVPISLPAGAVTLTTLASFNGANGANPRGSFVSDGAGNLFGMTELGGDAGLGTIFRLDTTTNTLTTMVSFDGTNGARPWGSLIADGAGNLFGTTTSGGSSNQGTIFRLDTATNTLTTMVSFDGTNGAMPRGSLVADGAGNLFGTTVTGGACCGTVFRLDTATNTFTTLASFDFPDSFAPWADLISDGAGNLFGTTLRGSSGGTVFRLDTATNTLTTLARFNNSQNGSEPNPGLVFDGAGNLFGTTYFGGSSLHGTVFRLDTATNTLTTSWNFADGRNGASPRAGLIADSAGNLFGTTERGGRGKQGTVFRLDPSTNRLTTLAWFTGANGARPFGSLFADSAGNLFGTTSAGGKFGKGTVFRISKTPVVPEPATWLTMIAGFGAVGVVLRHRQAKSCDMKA